MVANELERSIMEKDGLIKGRKVGLRSLRGYAEIRKEDYLNCLNDFDLY